MGSAGLKYDADGKVAWNEIWGSFCDLAMAGGPPHKGTLLEPASAAEIEAEPERHQNVVDEICRGITMVSELAPEASPIPGWVRVECDRKVTAVGLAGEGHRYGERLQLLRGDRDRFICPRDQIIAWRKRSRTSLR